MVEDGDLYGNGVNVAARLEQIAEPGGVVISRKVHDEISRKLALTYDDLGARSFKNIAMPVQAYRVFAPREESASLDLPLPVKPSIAVLWDASGKPGNGTGSEMRQAAGFIGSWARSPTTARGPRFCPRARSSTAQ